MIDRETLDEVIFKQRDRIRGELKSANRAVYSAAGIYILEILMDEKKKKYRREYMAEHEIIREFRKYDKRFEEEDITSAIQRLINSKKIITYFPDVDRDGIFEGSQRYKLAK